MDKKQVSEKLTILLSSNVISENSYAVTLKTFDFLSKKYNKKTLEDSDMFWTHMCMALTRIERGDSIEGPPENILGELNQTPYKAVIEEVINYVNSQITEELPQEESSYFFLHLHRVIDSNK